MKGAVRLIIISIVLAIVFTLSMIGASVAYAEDNNSVEIKMTEFYPAPNEEFSTTLYVGENSQIASLDFTLQYDSDYVTFISFAEINATVNHDASTHRIHIAYANPQNATARLELARLTFVVDNNIAPGLYSNWLTWIGEDDDEAYTISNSNYQAVDIRANLNALFVRQKGDAYNNNNDGKVNSLDALHCLRQSVGSIQMSDIDIYYANVYTDNDAANIAKGRSVIDSRDAIKILQYSVKMNVVLDTRVNISFYDIDNNGDYYLQIAKSVTIGETLEHIPTILSHDGYENGEWSLSPNLRKTPDFSNIQNGFSVYAVYDHTGRTEAGYETYYKVIDALDVGFFQAGKYIVNDFQLPYKSAYGSFNMLTSGEFSAVDIIWNPDSKQLAQGISIRDNYTVSVPNIDYTTWVTFSANIYIDGIKYGIVDFDREIRGTIDLPSDDALNTIIASVSTDFAVEGETYRLPGYVSLATGRMQYNVEMVQDVDIKWTLVDGNEKGFDGKKYGFIYLYEENPVKLKAQFSIDNKVFKTSYVELTVPAKTWDEQKEYATTYLQRYVPKTLSGVNLFPTSIERFDFQVEWKSGSASGKLDTSLPVYDYKDEIYQQIGVGQNAGYMEQGYLDAMVRRGDDSFTLSFPLFIAGESDEVSFINDRMPDLNLYNALLPIFGVDDGQGGTKLTEQSLANCEVLNTKSQNYTLDLSNKGIENLKGIEYVTGVKRLVLSYNDLSGDNANLVRLASLTNLEQLELSHCNLYDANLSNSIFTRMYKLEGIDLSYNNLTNLSFLHVGRQLSSLTDLFAQDNDLIDIGALSYVNDKGNTVSAIPNVKRLTLTRKEGSSFQSALDISALQYATNLSILWLANHNINDLSALTNCKLLTVLDLRNNDITATSKENDLIALRNLTSLGTLFLDNNHITVVNELRKLRGLVYLSLSHNTISSLSTYLNQMSGLEYLDLDGNALTSVNLTYFSGLKYFYAENNHLTQIIKLDNAVRLEELRLNGNDLERSTIDNIATLSELKYLSLSDNEVGDLAFLSELTKLTHLELANCALNQSYQVEETDQYTNETYYVEKDNVARLYGLNQLRVLDISNNDTITDISGLTDGNGGLTNLKVFYLDNVKLTNADSIRKMGQITDLSMQNSGVQSLGFAGYLDAAKYVNLSGHTANNINGNWFSAKADLKYLFLDSAIDTSQASNLPELGSLLQLQYLSLRNVAVDTIDNIPEMEAIVYLDLANTKIVNFVGTVDENGIRYSDMKYDFNLKYLDVSGNDYVFTKSNLNALYDLCYDAPFNGNLNVWLYTDRDIVGFDATREAATIHSYLTQFDELSSDSNRKQIHTFYNGSDYTGYGSVTLQNVLNEYDLVWSLDDSNFAVSANILSVADWKLFADTDLTLHTAIDVYDNDGIGATMLNNTVYVAPSPYEVKKYSAQDALFDTETRYFNIPIVALADGARDNFIFDGWYTQTLGNGLEITEGYVNVALYEGAVKDISVYAKWLYQVTYDVNGGESIEYVSKEFLEGNCISYPSVSKLGFQPGGWYYGEDKLNDDFVSEHGSITVYIKWVGENVTIDRFDHNSKFGNSELYEYGEIISLATLSSAKLGYTFVSWYTDYSLTKPVSGNIILDSTTLKKTNNEWRLTLYGKWNANTYALSYNGNKPNNATHDIIDLPNATICAYDSDVVLGTAPSLEGWVFGGWYKDAACQRRLGSAEQQLTKPNLASSGEIEVYAKWTAIQYYIYYDESIPNALPNRYRTVACTYDSTTLLDFFRVGGWYMEGWYTERSYIHRVGSPNVSCVPNLTKEAGETVTLYAKWIQIPISIHYSANGGNGEMEDTPVYIYNNLYNCYLENNGFQKEGYVFVGWATSPNDTSALWSGGDVLMSQYAASSLYLRNKAGKGRTYNIPIYSDDYIITLYAVWKTQ